MAKPKTGFRKMSLAELLTYCQELYRREGIKAFAFDALMNHGSLYWALYKQGLTQGKLIDQLGLKDEYKAFKEEQPLIRAGGPTKRWTWTRIVETAKIVAAKEGSLPPGNWFQVNGYGALVTALYNSGHTWDQLQVELGDFTNSSFVESRNALRWRSHPEASLSNFLYTRGIEHKRGERYPEEYGQQSKSKYGYFDLHFRDDNGDWVDVEIWGDKPRGHNEADYSQRRLEKEEFNKANERFLGIHYADCFKEDVLADILLPHLARRAAFRFDKPTDPLIPATHWSNTDELLSYCQSLAASMPDGEFPTEEWLRKRGKWATRSGPAYNTVSVYIKTWFGGIRNLRCLLGQAHISTVAWDREAALAAYRKFFDTHELTPHQVRGSRRKDTAQFSTDAIKEAARICAAIDKHAGGAVAANQALGIDVVRGRKWSRDKIIESFRDVTSWWNMSPSQVLSDHKNGKHILPPSELDKINQMVDAALREFGGSKAVMALIGFKTPTRSRRKRRPQKFQL